MAARETVLVTGASGGVGTALVQLAKIRGATVVAIVGAAKKDLVRDIGADAVVTRGHDVTSAVEQVVGARVDAVADVVGGKQVGELLQLLRPGGRYVVAGAIAGPLVTVDLRTIYLKQLEVLGSTMGNRDEFAALSGTSSRVDCGRSSGRRTRSPSSPGRRPTSSERAMSGSSS